MTATLKHWCTIEIELPLSRMAVYGSILALLPILFMARLVAIAV